MNAAESSAEISVYGVCLTATIQVFTNGHQVCNCRSSLNEAVVK